MKVLAALFVAVGLAASMAPFARADGMANCKATYIKESKLVLGGYYSDADKTSVGARRECETRHSMDRKAFETKYGKVEKPISAKSDVKPVPSPAPAVTTPSKPNVVAERPDSGGGGKGPGRGGNASSGGDSNREIRSVANVRTK